MSTNPAVINPHADRRPDIATVLAPFTGPPQPASPPSPAPPAYSVREPPDIRTVLAPYLPHSSQSAHALDCRSQAPPPSGCESVEPIKLHIYKESALFGEDDIITGPDKQEILYYLRFPKHFFSSRWELSLRRGGPEGPEIAQIHKGGASWKDSFEIRWTGGAITPCTRTGVLSFGYQFPGSCDTYCWKDDSIILAEQHYSLVKVSDKYLPREQRPVLARWRKSVLSASKAGCLEINPEYVNEMELILATAIGLEERARERGEDRRHRSTFTQAQVAPTGFAGF